MKNKLEIHLHTNYSCNLNCEHCYNESGVNKKVVLPDDFVLTLLQLFCERYQAEFHLEGGEIFLRPDLLSAMDALSDEVLQCITITTNGTIRQQDNKVLSMLRRIGTLRISVEGHTNEHQRTIRGIDIDRVLDNAKFYLDSGVPVWLRVTLNQMNQDGFVNLTLPTLQTSGFNNIQVYEFQRVGRGRRAGIQLALDGSLSKFLNQLCCYSDLIIGHIKFMFPHRRLQEIKAFENQLVDKQYRVRYLEPEAGISIHADGEVFKCAWDNDVIHSLGNIFHLGVEGLFSLLGNTDLMHDCEHCSAVCIEKPKVTVEC